ncbi:uncharacterized protein B0H18DRAFT_85427 [Fomitopsis serialis]|uniref:uncharacterized protein n=1 Tax=Fomitopsis serialis TaxID=139415 RepID=UPI0020075FA3|nr:uncharacterized protein B0H18DRAFT_85427 [Neoantrodia serialis]KAH9931482.1 hypothetical protein B0H18DRAFT_85427 [Neoantrodia serialis]
MSSTESNEIPATGSNPTSGTNDTQVPVAPSPSDDASLPHPATGSASHTQGQKRPHVPDNVMMGRVRDERGVTRLYPLVETKSYTAREDSRSIRSLPVSRRRTKASTALVEDTGTAAPLEKADVGSSSASPTTGGYTYTIGSRSETPLEPMDRSVLQLYQRSPYAFMMESPLKKIRAWIKPQSSDTPSKAEDAEPSSKGIPEGDFAFQMEVSETSNTSGPGETSQVETQLRLMQIREHPHHPAEQRTDDLGASVSNNGSNSGGQDSERIADVDDPMTSHAVPSDSHIGGGGQASSDVGSGDIGSTKTGLTALGPDSTHSGQTHGVVGDVDDPMGDPVAPSNTFVQGSSGQTAQTHGWSEDDDPVKRDDVATESTPRPSTVDVDDPMDNPDLTSDPNAPDRAGQLVRVHDISY